MAKKDRSGNRKTRQVTERHGNSENNSKYRN